MSRTIILIVLLAGFIVVGTITPVWAAQLDARINPNSDTSPVKMSYLKTIFIEYPNGGNLFDELRGKSWTVSGTADLSNPGVQELLAKINQRITDDGSQARFSDLNVYYDFQLNAGNIHTSIDYRVILEGILNNYIITQDSQRILVDMGWRGISAEGPIVIDGIDINIPINLIKNKEPRVYTFLTGTEAEEILSKNLINEDFILELPLTNWQFLFNPLGINVDAGTFGLSEDIAGFVVSSLTMGESTFREGIQIERVFEAEIQSDETYVVRSVQSSDQGKITILGLGALDVIDGVEIVVIPITPTSDPPPKEFSIIVYGVTAIAIVAGIVFIVNRSLKNKKQ